MADYKATTAEFQSVANAIRTKGGTSAQLEWPVGFVNAIGAIPSGGSSDPFLYSFYNFFGNPEGTASTSLSCTIEGPIGKKAILIVMHRDSITVSGGMTLVNSETTESRYQWISLYEKILESESESITITQNSNVRMCACSMCVNADTTFSAPVQQANDANISAYRYTIAPSEKIRLAVINNNWSGGTGSTSIVPSRQTAPSDLLTAQYNVRMAAFVVNDFKNVVFTAAGTIAEEARVQNRLFLYDIN